jgi:polysaccharide export outer membrane protein
MMGSATLLLANADDSKKQAEPDFSPSPGATVPGISYRIGAGDILQINVLKEPDASVAAVSVRSDGVISLPYLKDVHAAGLTPRELEATLTGKLARFIREPDVTVVVKEIHSEMVYLIGAVRKEGAVRLSGPLTVLQAVANAGGLTDYAKRSKIYILRMEHSKQVRIPFDYSAVVKGDRLQDNILLRPGDTIVVPQ